MASGAGSIVGTATAVGGGALALARGSVGGSINAVSGMRGGSLGNSSSVNYKSAQALQGMYEKFRTGGVK